MSCGNCKSNVNNGGGNVNSDRAGCRYCRNFDCKCRKHPYEENNECRCIPCYLCSCCNCGCIQPRTDCVNDYERGFDDGFTFDECSCKSHNNVNGSSCGCGRSGCERGYNNGCTRSGNCENSGQKEFYDTGYDKGFSDGRSYNCRNMNYCGNSCSNGCNQRQADYEKGYEKGFDDGFSTDGCGNPNVPITHNPCAGNCGSWNSCSCNNGCNCGCNGKCNHRNSCGCNHC